MLLRLSIFIPFLRLARRWLWWLSTFCVCHLHGWSVSIASFAITTFPCVCGRNGTDGCVLLPAALPSLARRFVCSWRWCAMVQRRRMERAEGTCESFVRGCIDTCRNRVRRAVHVSHVHVRRRGPFRFETSSNHEPGSFFSLQRRNSAWARSSLGLLVGVVPFPIDTWWARISMDGSRSSRSFAVRFRSWRGTHRSVLAALRDFSTCEDDDTRCPTRERSKSARAAKAKETVRNERASVAEGGEEKQIQNRSHGRR